MFLTVLVLYKNITYAQRFKNYVKQLMSNELCESHAPVGHEVLRYELEGRGFDSQWCHWNSSLT